jgi:hypothetical protein
LSILDLRLRSTKELLSICWAISSSDTPSVYILLDTCQGIVGHLQHDFDTGLIRLVSASMSQISFYISKNRFE